MVFFMCYICEGYGTWEDGRTCTHCGGTGQKVEDFRGLDLRGKSNVVLDEVDDDIII